MATTACADPGAIRVTKVLGACDPFSATPSQAKVGTYTSGDTVTFAVAVANIGGETVVVDIEDTVPAVFDDVAWTRTGPTGTVTTGTGSIDETGVSLAAGKRVTFLVTATFTPEPCTSLVTNVVRVTPDDPAFGCCGPEGVIEDYAQVINADGPTPKLDPARGWTAMEALYHLVENLSLADRVTLADFVNGCGTLATVTVAAAGDGVAVEILDAEGEGTGLYAETTPGA